MISTSVHGLTRIEAASRRARRRSTPRARLGEARYDHGGSCRGRRRRALRIMGGFAAYLAKCRRLLQFYVAARAEGEHKWSADPRRRGDAGCAVCQRGAWSCAAGRKCREETATSRRRQHQITCAPKAQRGDAQRQGPSRALAFFFSGLCDVSKTDGEAAVKPASKAATAWRCARRPGSPAGGRPAGSRCS